MDKFSKWTGLAHFTLKQSHRKIRLCQVRELLSAWLGHRTYTSLRVADLSALLGRAKYAIIDADAAMSRANALGIDLTAEQWKAVEYSLQPSGVSGELWLVSKSSLASAARLIFEDQSHPDIDLLWQPVGMPDGRLATSVTRLSIEPFPDVLEYVVQGHVRAFNDDESLAIPVVAHVRFKRVGARLYEQGEIYAVKPHGARRSYEPNDEMETYGGFDD